MDRKVGAVAALFLGLLLSAQAQDEYTGFTTVEVAPGLYSYISRECTPAGVVSGNVTAVIGEHSVLVVDSGHFPSATRKIIAHLQSVTRKPVRYLLNTHWHQDHVMGNAEFREAHPGVVILAHPFTAQELAKPQTGSDYAQGLLASVPQALETLRGMQATGKRPDGTELNEDQKAAISERLAAYQAAVGEARLMRFVPPEVRVAGDMEILLGGRSAKVMWLGIGNTEGDLLVYVPETKVLITGDLLVYPTPFALDSQLLPWSETLEKLASFDADKIVPGHGPVMENKDYIFAVRDLLRSMARQVEAAKAAGLTKEQARAKLDVEDFRKKYVTTRLREGAFQQWFLRPIVENAYKPATSPASPQ